MRSIAKHFIVFAFLWLAAPASIGLQASGSSPVLGSAFGSNSGEEFLRVEDAYRLFATIEDDELLLLWTIAPGYYLYQEKFAFVLQRPEGNRSLEAEFEPGKRVFDEFFGKELEVYYEQTQVRVPLPDSDDPFKLAVQSQGCADAGLCYPPRTQYLQVNPPSGTVLEIAQSGAPAASAEAGHQVQPTAPTLPASPGFVLWSILAAILGGIILNLMPCVFPVLSLKALSFASSHLSPHKQHIHGWAYTAGIVSSFLLAAGVILTARAAGQTVGWGFQLQSPEFIAFMAYLFFTMALSLAGLFQLGTRLMGLGQSLTSGHGIRASFFTGVLAAVVASPCTAPLMATALGFAVTQPASLALVIFAALGFGMALPFLLLSYSPKLAERLPQPGPWMETLKQLLAFPLLLTFIWLLWVLGHQVGSDAVAALLLGATAIAFGIWLWHHQPASRYGRFFIRGLVTATIAAALALALQIKHFADADMELWQPYSARTLNSLRASNTPVFVNVTADWCITCLANDRVALHTDAVTEAAAELGVVLLKADWTNPNPEISALLQQFNRSGIPLYLMYPAAKDAEVEILPQVLTRQRVVEAMYRATEPKAQLR